MLSPNKIGKRFGLFLAVYFGLVILFQWTPLQNGYNAFYAQVGDRVFNLFNPHYFTDLNAGAPQNDKNWNMTFKIYSRAEHKGKIGNPSYRARVNPERLFYRNLYDLALLPILFLFALFISTPKLSWKRKILYFMGSMFIFYVFLTFHYSHIIENLIINDGEIGDSLWEKFVSIFGFQGLTEPLYIIAIVTWAVFVFRKPLLIWLQEKDETKA